MPYGASINHWYVIASVWQTIDLIQKIAVFLEEKVVYSRSHYTEPRLKIQRSPYTEVRKVIIVIIVTSFHIFNPKQIIIYENKLCINF